MKKSEIFFNALRLPIDFAAVSGAFFVARIIRLHPTFLANFQSPADTNLAFENFAQFAAIASGVLILIFAANGMYRMRSQNLSKDFRKVIFLVAAWLLILTAYFFFRREFFFSRLALVYAGILTTVFILLGRILIRFFQRIFWTAGVGVTRILVIGTNPNSLVLGNFLAHNPRFRFAGFVEVACPRPRSGGKLPHEFPEKPIGEIEEFEKIVKRRQISEIVLASRKLSNVKMRELLAFCRVNHLGFSFVPDLLEVPQKNVEIETVAGIPLISLRPTPLDGWGRIGKRIFDFLGSLFFLIISSPIWLVTALIIKFDSRGPIFFTRKDDGSKVVRVGKHGEPFWFVKFRSMRAKSDSLRYSRELAEKNTRKNSPLVKIENDPRVTRVGRFIRKYSIDELPQLLNVLTGKMSLVGPRPHLPEEVEKYKPHHRRVLEIKPGITGLGQISGRSDLDFEEEVALDTWYIENWSVWLDLKILWKTIGVVLFPKHKE
ncbi:MAG: sugar transferase [Candidatus Peribacteraceae bacterium]|nr:sugar transferase [Candidatus Peribacteraceae bacterium]